MLTQHHDFIEHGTNTGSKHHLNPTQYEASCYTSPEQGSSDDRARIAHHYLNIACLCNILSYGIITCEKHTRYSPLPFSMLLNRLLILEPPTMAIDTYPLYCTWVLSDTQIPSYTCSSSENTIHEFIIHGFQSDYTLSSSANIVHEYGIYRFLLSG